MQLRWLVKSSKELDITDTHVRCLDAQVYNLNNRVLQVYTPVDYHEMIPIYDWVDVPIVEEMVDE